MSAKAMRATMVQFRDVKGVWMVKGRRYFAPYQNKYDSMTKAIGGALADIEFNSAYPERIECDGVQIFDRDDLSTLDYDTWMEDV